MNYNNLTFTTIEKKKLNLKNVIFVSIAFLIILISIILLITSNSKEETNEEIAFAENQMQLENNTVDKTLQDASQSSKKIPPIPAYTENAKLEMSNIYKSDIKRVFLTFDDGPSQTVTPLILEILRQNDIKATFFVLGSRVELAPEILKQEYKEGHYIANHGYSHSYKDIYAVPENVLNEYIQTENCIREALGIQEYTSHLFRFPGGSTGGKYSNVKKEAIKLLIENEIEYVDWNALTKDAEGNFDKEILYSNLVETAQNKNSIVVLMHDAGTKKTTVEALQDIIKYFKENEYQFASFYDIMR